MGFFTWSRLYFVSRMVLGGVFVYASLDKIQHPDIFAQIVYNYQILPAELVNLAAVLLPWIELMAGLFLLTGVQPLPAAMVLTALVVVFLGVLGFNVARGLDFDCGCFSTSPDVASAGLRTLFRDMLLLFPAFICLYEGWRRDSGKSRTARSGGPDSPIHQVI